MWTGNAEAKFRTDDRVRLIGTDTIQTVRQYDEDTLEYQVQQDDDAVGAVWVPGMYLELVDRLRVRSRD
jgi:hypothetical protein